MRGNLPVKVFLLTLVLFLVGVGPSHGQAFATLPAAWVDNNAAFDGVNCGGYCSGAGVTPPAYELSLGPSTAVWITSPPACTGVFQPLSTYVSTATGKLAAITDMEACRTYGITHGGAKYCTILDVPPLSSQVAPPAGVPAGAYWSANGVLIPQTSNVAASCFNVVRSSAEPSLLLLPEPVCAGGIQDNLPTSLAIRLINPDCTGNHLAYQQGTTLTSIPVGPFTLANGLSTNTAAYNYVQYLYQDVCTATSNCIAFQLCSVTATSSSPCAGTTMGPDHWLFEDGTASQSAGNHGSNEIITTGSGTNSIASEAQFANSIHFRRYWSHGDWTDLASGSNSSTNGFNLSMCKNCSIVGSQVSQMLRPGGEGHSVLANATFDKIVYNVFEGNSSCVFTGGLSFTPFLGWVPARDMQEGRNVCTYPYQWLGYNNTFPCNPFCGTIPNANPYWGAATANWTTAPTMVYVSGSTLNWVSGDTFHDSTSTWPANTVKIGGATYHLAAAGSWTQTCGAFCFPSNPPTQIPLTTSCSSGCGTIGSPVTFTMSPNNTVRKNGDEKKEAVRYLKYGEIVENVDQSGGQNGVTATINVRNRSGGAIGQNYYSTIQDLTILDSIYRHTCWGIELAARSSSIVGDGGGTSQMMNRVEINNVLHYDISGKNPGCPNTHVGFQASSGGQTWQGTVTENGAGNHATFVANYSVDAAQAAATLTATSVTTNVLTVTVPNSFIAGQAVNLVGTAEVALNGKTVVVLAGGLSPTQFTANLTTANYTNASDTGTATGLAPMSQSTITASSVTANVVTVTAANNFIVGELVTPVGTAETALNGQQLTVLASGLSPTQFTANLTTGNYTNASDSGTVSGPAGFEVFNVPTGSPVAITNCTNGAFNVSTRLAGSYLVPVGIGAQPLNPVVSTGSTLWGGTFVAGNVTVAYPWTATANLSDSSGTCTITNQEGGPQHMRITHLTMITDANQSFGNGNQPKAGPNFQYDHVFRDSIITSSGNTSSGWYNSAVGEGTPTQTFNYDPGTLTADHLVWPTRTASKYTAYGNNPTFPVASPVLYFPAKDYCIGLTTTSACVGFIGAMNLPSGPMPLALSDYHGYALRTDSDYYAGNSKQASDGTSEGANLTAIDARMLQDPFQCPSACGSPGPYPDLGGPPPVAPPPPIPLVIFFTKNEARPELQPGGNQ